MHIHIFVMKIFIHNLKELQKLRRHDIRSQRNFEKLFIFPISLSFVHSILVRNTKISLDPIFNPSCKSANHKQQSKVNNKLTIERNRTEYQICESHSILLSPSTEKSFFFISQFSSTSFISSFFLQITITKVKSPLRISSLHLHEN